MAKKRKVRKPHSKVGRFFAKLAALPGEEPVFDEPQKEHKKKEQKPRVHINELKAAVDSVNAASSRPLKSSSSSDRRQEDIDNEYASEFSHALDHIEKHTKDWKKTGETGLFIPPRVTMKERVSNALDNYRSKHSKNEEKRWIPFRNVPFKPKKFLLFRSKIDKQLHKKRSSPDLDIQDVFKQVEKIEVRRGDDEIDNIYKQLGGR